MCESTFHMTYKTRVILTYVSFTHAPDIWPGMQKSIMWVKIMLSYIFTYQDSR